MRRALIVLGDFALASCRAEPLPMPPSGGTAGGQAFGAPPSSPPAPSVRVRAVGSAPAAILLTAREYDAALFVLVGDTSQASRQLPNAVEPDTNHPFDTLWEQTVV